MKITVKIFGEPIELTVADAKKLYRELHELFGEEQPNYTPAPVFPWPQAPYSPYPPSTTLPSTSPYI
jgi:hypothetical protein